MQPQEDSRGNHPISNRLITEKSPYLLQHAYNPVDWFRWGEEAFDTALREDKPIFLSVGYSTCHWCHVMAHESFEDAEVARLMNETFICIKVDREERPDIDAVYMTVAQMMTGSGGWPLTIFMTPQKKPFFAATYIPKESRWGRTGLMEIIPRIDKIWKTRRDEVSRSAEQIAEALKKVPPSVAGDELDVHLMSEAYDQLAGQFDPRDGGFGTPPKFPTPHNLSFLLRYWQSTSDEQGLRMVEETLHKMQRGGIYDHLGFGFHRYSTDSQWLVPHFEKMLYDQAMLAIAYIEAYQATGKVQYQRTAREIFSYVLRDMTSPEGGFYSAEDADSEGVEGKFYIWTLDEIRLVLDEESAQLIIDVFNVTPEGNFAEEATGHKTGANILHLRKSIEEIVADRGVPKDELREKIEQARQKLFAHREERVHPHKDDKILTDWNGLMIAALAKGAQAFDAPEYAKAARHAADFVLRTIRRADGRLMHRYRDGEAAVMGYAEDYAFLIWGLLDLYEATFDPADLQTALDLNEQFVTHFWDEQSGGFYSTSDDAEELLVRQKGAYDGAVPSANSVAMLNLLRLGRITANPEFDEKAAQIGQVFSESVKKIPVAYTQLLCALAFSVGPAYEIVIVGNSTASDTQAMLKALRKEFIPHKVVLFNPTEASSPAIHQLAEYTRHQPAVDGQATAYVCRNHACQQPTTNINQMLQILKP